MNKFKIDRRNTELFSDFQNQLVYEQESLGNILNLSHQLDNYSKQISIKSKSYLKTQREILANVLLEQHQGKKNVEQALLQIELLRKETTFTVTTGHQLNIFTGPIFFIYKILHTIKLCVELKKKFPENDFVPIYWMASEDHDFEEVNHVQLFGKTLQWNSTQSGAVGRYSLEGFEEIKNEFAHFFKDEALEEINEILSNYQGKNLADATFSLVNKLFSSFGLVVLNADHFLLKKCFVDLMKKEIESQFSFKNVSVTNDYFKENNYKVQVNPREINLFYLGNNARERVMLENNQFKINGVGDFKLNEILELLENQAENFSPNVILRPLYQELILPNLAYIGGLGEITYWAQLKSMFETTNVPFPILIVRNSFLIVDEITNEKIAKIGLSIEDFFSPLNQIIQKYISKNEDETIDLSIVKQYLSSYKESLISKVAQVDANLLKMIEAEMVKMDKQYDFITDRIHKSVKQKHENAIKSIESIQQKLFPNGGLQERSLNLFSLRKQKNIDQIIHEIFNAIEPFEKDLIILTEQNNSNK